MRLAVPVAAVAGLIAVFVTAGLTQGQQGKVLDTAHDLGVLGDTFGVSPCEVCHLPHEPGGEPLWAESPLAQGAFSGIAPGCYSCHDGTVTATGTHVFDANLAQHPVQPGKPGQDCDMCHDPHVSDFGSFLLFPSGANLCKTCHAEGDSLDHPVNVNVAAHGYVPTDASRDPGADDFTGSRLWNPEGTSGGAFMKCLSCHVGHGALSDALLSWQAEGAGSLCSNCHRW